MRSNRSLRFLVPGLLLAGLLLTACPAEDDETPEPEPPTYPPADIQALVDADGGTGGGPNMGACTVVVFDKVTGDRIQGAEVLLYHGSGNEERMQTDADGTAAFTGITPGAVTVTALEQGYVNQTMVDVNAATVVLPMEGRLLLVSGTVKNVQPNHHVKLELMTKTYDPIDRKREAKYGYVSDVNHGTPDTPFELRFKAGAVDTLLVREVHDSSGRTERSLEYDLGGTSGWFTDQTGVNIDLTGAGAGLHELTVNADDVWSDAHTVIAYYETDHFRYPSYSTSPPATAADPWVIQLQLPPNLANAKIVVEAYAEDSTPGEDLPRESWETTKSTGPAGEATTLNMSFDMVTLSGDFLHPLSYPDVFFVVARYDGRFHATLGMQNPFPDYAIRVPNGRDVDLRVIELAEVSSEGGTFVAALDDSVHYTSHQTHDFDLSGAGVEILDMTAPVPAGISTTEGMALLTGPFDSSAFAGEFMAVPYMTKAAEAGGQLDYPLPFKSVTGVSTYLLVVLAQEKGLPEGERPESMYIRGNLADPSSDPGPTSALDLLDIPAVLAPLESETVPRASLLFAWLGDAAVATEGVHTLKIADGDGVVVWNVLVRGSTQQFMPPVLPADLRTEFDLAAGTEYDIQVGSAATSGLDFDDFTFDIMPGEIDEIVSSNNAWYIANHEPVPFQVN